MKYSVLFFSQCALLLFLVAHVQAKAASPEQASLQQQLQGDFDAPLVIGQTNIAAANLIRAFYLGNAYRRAWKQQSLIDVLIEAIEESYDAGLSPEDYHISEIKERISKQTKIPEQQAQLDIILTDALFRLIYNYAFGKVVPGKLDPDWNFSREFITEDPVAKLQQSLTSTHNLQKLLHEYNQYGPFYQGLVKALAEYRQIQLDGGWQAVPAGQVIKPGMQDPRMPLIKARLLASSDLENSYDNNNVNINNEYIYTEGIETGIRRFQQRHQLDVDGIIGKGTLAQMNVPVEQRVDQIRANLERIRWVHRNLGDEFVLVNIAGYRVYYINDNELIWQSRVQVGTNYRKTPVFRDDITYLVINPTWTVPPTILAKDILPKLKKDISYLQKKNMNIIDSKGNVINPDSIDWSVVTARHFPYMIRQEPGPANALGRIKVMFPNSHMVYLHDTPSKSKFNRVDRAFSSGCIRVEHPFELAELLMKDRDTWNQQSFKEVLDSEQLQMVKLPQSVPVLLLYFTAEMNVQGQFIFYKDVYNRDDKVIQGLKQPFRLVPPEQRTDLQSRI